MRREAPVPALKRVSRPCLDAPDSQASPEGIDMGQMNRAIAREEQERRTQDRFASTLVIAASIIAAVRLARDQDIGSQSPRVVSVIHESVSLARRILETVIR